MNEIVTRMRRKIASRLSNEMNLTNISNEITAIKNTEKENARIHAELLRQEEEKNKQENEDLERIRNMEYLERNNEEIRLRKLIEDMNNQLIENNNKLKANLNIRRLIPQRKYNNTTNNLNTMENIINKNDISKMINEKKEQLIKYKEELKLIENIKMQEKDLEEKRKTEEIIYAENLMIQQKLKDSQNLLSKKFIYIKNFRK